MGHQHFNGVKTAVLFGAFGGLILFASWLVFGVGFAMLAIERA